MNFWRCVLIPQTIEVWIIKGKTAAQWNCSVLQCYRISRIQTRTTQIYSFGFVMPTQNYAILLLYSGIGFFKFKQILKFGSLSGSLRKQCRLHWLASRSWNIDLSYVSIIYQYLIDCKNKFIPGRKVDNMKHKNMYTEFRGLSEEIW